MTYGTHWTLEPTGSGVTAWIDVPGQSQNVFSAGVLNELDAVLTDLESRPDYKFVLFRSRKPYSFFAGADIREFTKIESHEQAVAVSARGQELFQRIADLPCPTVAVISGACLGGGLEMALACRYRLAVDDPATRLGLPETELGILPGWGGTQRLPKLVGTLQAIGMILQAHKLTAKKARKAGLVDFVCAPAELESRLKELTDKLSESGSLGEPQIQRTWIGWFLNETGWGRSLTLGGTEKKIQRQSDHYPALGKSLQAIRLAYLNPKAGYEFERQAIAELIFTPTSRNLVQLFLSRERARNPATWNPTGGTPLPEPLTVAVLGGGTMGAGIAQLAAKSGIQVVLREVNDAALDAARQRIDDALQALVKRGSLSEAQKREQQQAIQFTTAWDPLQSAQIVVEAVPEVMALKQTVFRELDQHCPPETVLASNTSALSVAEIGSVVAAPQRVAGLHFFNPVHRMDLIEVVRTPDSSAETIDLLMALCKKLGKTPIQVRDSPGFVVNRVLMPYLDEALKLALERTARGEDLQPIDREMKRFGMPMGPLELLDQVGLDVAAHVASTMTIVFGEDSVSARLMERMIAEGRLGRKSGHGFYQYQNGVRGKLIGIKPLVGDIEMELPDAPETPLSESLSAIQQRLVLAMVNEAARCLDENVIEEAWMLDLAMVLGTGFAPFHGGPLRFANRFSRDELLQTLELLAKAYGARYQPANWLMLKPTQE